MHSSLVRRGLALLASVALVAGVAACSGDNTGNKPKADVPGVTDTEILIGTHMPLTGPASPGYMKIGPASKAFFDYVNANGGVHGRKITYKVMDDGYNPANTQNVVRQLVLQDKVFAIMNGLGTPTHSGVLDFLKTNKVPDLFVASGSRSWNQPDKYPGTFGWQTDYTVEGKILANYVKNTYAGKKVCFLGQGDDFGRDSLAGVEKILTPADVTDKQTYVVTTPNVGPQIGSFKAKGCEVVILATVPGFTALALGTAARLSYKPQFVVSSVGGDYTTLAGRLGDAKGLLEGLTGAGYLPLQSQADDPWIKLFQKINADFNKGVVFDGNIIYGMSVAYMFVQVLQAAGKDLTREGLIAAVEKGGYVGPGLSPVRYSKTDHSGYGGERIVTVTGGVQSFVGPAYETDDGDGAVKEYTVAQAQPPANGIPTS